MNKKKTRNSLLKKMQATLLATRIIFFLFTFICNSVMWTMFTKALNAASSSVQVSIVNGAANFSASVRKRSMFMLKLIIFCRRFWVIWYLMNL